MAEQKFDVFLCHNSEDKSDVIKIAEQLKSSGLKPWLDIWELQPGAIWQYALEQQIEKMNSAAVFVGANGLGPWQSEEIYALLQEFVRRQCPVIPAMLPKTGKQPVLPLFLRSRHWVDFRSETPDPLKQLIWGVTGQKRDELSNAAELVSTQAEAISSSLVSEDELSALRREIAVLKSQAALQQELSKLQSQSVQAKDDLSSELGFDYIYLRDLLQSKDWASADYETYTKLCMLLNVPKIECLDPDTVMSGAFPSKDLRIMDQLWRTYSDNHFGFSIQRKVFLDCGGMSNKDDDDVWRCVCSRLGWIALGGSYKEPRFSASAPKGHLPSSTRELGNAFYMYAQECTVFAFLHKCRL